MNRLTKYGVPIIISAGFGWVFFDFDKVLFAEYFDIAAVGLLTSALWAGSLLNTFNDILRQSCIPWFRKWCKNHYNFKSYALIYISHLLILLLFAITIFKFIEIVSIYNDHARDLVMNKLLKSVLLFYIIFGSFFTTATLLEYFSMSKIRMYYLILFALVKIFLSIILLKFFPEKNLIYISTVISYSFFVFMINVAIYRNVKPQC